MRIFEDGIISWRAPVVNVGVTERVGYFIRLYRLHGTRSRDADA